MSWNTVTIDQDPQTKAIHIRSAYGTDVVIEESEIKDLKGSTAVAKFLHRRAKVVLKLVNKNDVWK